jgi:hypothetical protein
MSVGPGKYDDEVTLVRERTEAEAVILIVIEGKRGSGFCAQTNSNVAPDLPTLLRHMANLMEADMRKLADDPPEDRPWRVPGGAH